MNYKYPPIKGVYTHSGTVYTDSSRLGKYSFNRLYIHSHQVTLLPEYRIESIILHCRHIRETYQIVDLLPIDS